MLKLKAKTWDKNTHETTEHSSDGEVAVVVTADELATHPFPTVITLDVIKGDKRCRFFISARINESGRPQCQVSHNGKTADKAVRKDVTGSFWLNNN